MSVGNLNSVDTVPLEMMLRSKKAFKYYGISQKQVLKSISVEPIGKSIVELVNSESIVKDVFVTLIFSSLKSLTHGNEKYYMIILSRT